MKAQEIVIGLIGLGMSQSSIARAVGVTQPTIWRAHNGSEVIYSTGVELKKLYDRKKNEEKKARH